MFNHTHMRRVTPPPPQLRFMSQKPCIQIAWVPKQFLTQTVSLLINTSGMLVEHGSQTRTEMVILTQPKNSKEFW